MPVRLHVTQHCSLFARPLSLSFTSCHVLPMACEWCLVALPVQMPISLSICLPIVMRLRLGQALTDFQDAPRRPLVLCNWYVVHRLSPDSHRNQSTQVHSPAGIRVRTAVHEGRICSRMPKSCFWDERHTAIRTDSMVWAWSTSLI